jgi:hypothetical protein
MVGSWLRSHPFNHRATRNERIIFEEVRRVLIAQNDQVDRLNNTIGFVTATASAFLVGFIALFTNAGGALARDEVRAPSVGPVTISDHTLLVLLFSIGILSYLLVAFGVFKAFHTQDWEYVPNPYNLFHEYWHEVEGQTIADLTESMVSAFNFNKVLVDTKLRWVNRCFVFVGIEGILLLVATLVGVWSGLL